VSTPATERLGAGRYLTAGERPAATVTTVHELTTADGATVRGVLATVPGATTVLCLLAAAEIVAWLAKRHELAPPG
jgi:hypothetical protein